MTKKQEKIWCGVCGREIPPKEYKRDLENLKNTPDNACKQCREERNKII